LNKNELIKILKYIRVDENVNNKTLSNMSKKIMEQNIKRFINKHKKVVTISQNLLPFQLKELLRFGLSIQLFKLVAIYFLQKYSFSRSDGVIFLTNYAKDVVQKSVYNPKFCIINHGVSDLFKNQIRVQLPICEYNDSNLFRIIYVSTIDCYKHQIPLISAVGKLIESGYPVALDLIGPINSRLLFKRMTNFIKYNISDSSKVIYHGEINYLDLPKFYQNSNLAVFSSTCENMPNILLEKMAAGLPIACSKYGPMPEILGDAGLYYDPEDSLDIEKTLKQYLNSSDLRSSKAHLGSDKIKNYSWSKCSNLTFNFLNSV